MKVKTMIDIDVDTKLILQRHSIAISPACNQFLKAMANEYEEKKTCGLEELEIEISDYEKRIVEYRNRLAVANARHIKLAQDIKDKLEKEDQEKHRELLALVNGLKNSDLMRRLG